MRPVVFSASSVNAYQSCHLQWYITYVLLEEGEPSEPQAVGIYVHEMAAIELENMADGIVPIGPDYDIPELKPLLEVFRQDILPTYRKAILIEAEFQLEVNGIPYSGIIDAVDEQDVPWGSALILRDLKTTASRPKAGKFRFAMTGYKLGAEDLLERPIDAAQLDYIVRTKQPYYWPEALDAITDEDIAIFAATLDQVANSVARGDYHPTGLGTKACSSCQHRAICGPYQRYQEVTDANR